VTFRRPTKVFEDGIQLMHLAYLLAFDGIIASRGSIPLIDQGVIVGAIGCSGALWGANQSKAILSAAHFQHNLSAFVRCAREHLVRNARLFQRKYGPYAGN
jgi:uncharacterized protein GlcG (DUF336 family)